MEWKSVVGYEGLYEVNELGEVKSLEREKFCGKPGSKPQIVKEKILSATKDKLGYMRVKLCNNDKGKHKKQHRIVAEAFIPNPLNKKEVNHKDGNKENNKVSNLEWCTRSENMLHARDNGLLNLSEDLKVYRRNTKIDMEIARVIRLKKEEGLKGKEISKMFNVSQSTVSMICKNLIWKEDL